MYYLGEGHFLPVGSGNLPDMKQQDNQQEDREQGGKGSMEYKVFIRGTDTFSMGTILLSLSSYIPVILQGERLSSAAEDSW